MKEKFEVEFAQFYTIQNMVSRYFDCRENFNKILKSNVTKNVITIFWKY